MSTEEDTLPGMPPQPQFEGRPVVRYRANIGGTSNIPAPGELRHGDRGYLRVYFNVEDIHHPNAEKSEKDNQGSLLGRRLMRVHVLKGLEAEFLTVEDEHGNPVTFNDGRREVG